MLVGIPLVGMTWGSLVVACSGFGCLVGNVCLFRSGGGVFGCDVVFCGVLLVLAGESICLGSCS